MSNRFSLCEWAIRIWDISLAVVPLWQHPHSNWMANNISGDACHCCCTPWFHRRTLRVFSITKLCLVPQEIVMNAKCFIASGREEHQMCMSMHAHFNKLLHILPRILSFLSFSPSLCQEPAFQALSPSTVSTNTLRYYFTV